jgi:Flp pilus assembly protein protease CpaA
MGSLPALVLAALISVWLVVCAVFDWRKREVPNVLTVVPFMLAVLWSAWTGNAPAALLAVAMMFVTNLDNVPAIVVTLLSSAFAIILSLIIQEINLQNLLPILIIVGISLLWYFGGTGGADAKILITLTLLFGYPAFIYAIVAGGLAGLVGLAIKEKQLPYVIPVAAGTILYLAVRTITIF